MDPLDELDETLTRDIPAFESAGWHVEEFARNYCRHTKGRWSGDAFELEEWQAEFCDEAFRLDEDGLRVYQTVLLGIPRKNGKSTLAAAIALYLLIADGEHGSEVILSAGSADQAALVFNQAAGFVEQSPDLSEWLDAQRLLIRVRGDSSSFLKRIAADGKLQHGLNPHGVVFDELHAVQTPKQEELVSAMTTGSGAREQPLSVFITTAGFDKDTVLGRLFDAALGSSTATIERRPGLTIVRDPAAGFLMYWYGLGDDEDSSDMAAVKAANPASWITEEWLARQRANPSVSLADFERLHCNRWTAAREVWIPWWPGLKREKLAPPDGSDVWLGVDVGLKNDSSAIGLAWQLPEGDELPELDAGESGFEKILGGELLLPNVGVLAHVMANRGDTIASHYFDGGRVDWDYVENYIRELGRRYRVRSIAYDPRYFERSAATLSDEGFALIELDQASETMAKAYQSFYNGTKDVRVFHDGDAILTAHVAATAASMTNRGWSIRKLRSRQKIDGLVSVVMAHHFAAKRAAVSPYEKRGLRILD